MSPNEMQRKNKIKKKFTEQSDPNDPKKTNHKRNITLYVSMQFCLSIFSLLLLQTCNNVIYYDFDLQLCSYRVRSRKHTFKKLKKKFNFFYVDVCTNCTYTQVSMMFAYIRIYKLRSRCTLYEIENVKNNTPL